MVWCALGKNISAVYKRGRGVEIQNLGLILPIGDEIQREIEETPGKLTEKTLQKINSCEGLNESKFYLSETFLQSIEDYASFPPNNKYIDCYDPLSNESKVLCGNSMHINLQSIA